MDMRSLQGQVSNEFVSAIAKPDTKFIRNPLPVPVRHGRRDMDYDIDVPEYKMHYDVEVSDTDDFDQ